MRIGGTPPLSEAMASGLILYRIITEKQVNKNALENHHLIGHDRVSLFDRARRTRLQRPIDDRSIQDSPSAHKSRSCSGRRHYHGGITRAEQCSVNTSISSNVLVQKLCNKPVYVVTPKELEESVLKYIAENYSDMVLIAIFGKLIGTFTFTDTLNRYADLLYGK